MAFNSTTIWQGWSTGATDQGGGFDPLAGGGTLVNDLAATGGTTSTPEVSSASYTFDALDVGSRLLVQTGTNWYSGWYTITSVTAGKATLAAAPGQPIVMDTAATSRTRYRPSGLATTTGCASTSTPSAAYWMIDYSQQTGSRITYTDLVIDGTTNTDATSSAKPFGVHQIGNVVNITSGTGFTVQRVQITAIFGLKARFDKSLGTLGSTGGNGKLGGAIGSTSAITALTQALTAGNKVFLKGTFTLTATTTVIAAVKGDTTSGRISVEGFTTTPGQLDGRPTITSATNSVILITINDNDYFEFVHLNLTHTAATRGAAFTSVTAQSTGVVFIDLVIDGCLTFFNAIANFATTWIWIACEIKNTTSSTAALINSQNSMTFHLFGCDIHDNTGDGLRMSGNVNEVRAYFCIFDTNVVGVNLTTSASSSIGAFHNCTFVDNSSDGLKTAATSGGPVLLELVNNIFWSNGGADINNLDEQAPADANVRLNRNNASGDNTNARVGLAFGQGDVTLTATDPFTNRSGRDFTPNNTAGGGALLRAAGFPGAMTNATTIAYGDIGAVQHQDSGGGGSTGVIGGPNMRAGMMA